jgi:hypothetical protein
MERGQIQMRTDADAVRMFLALESDAAVIGLRLECMDCGFELWNGEELISYSRDLNDVAGFIRGWTKAKAND